MHENGREIEIIPQRKTAAFSFFVLVSVLYQITAENTEKVAVMSGQAS